ncbi:hypothetical protein CON64_18540 [Bacillus pseudomycoides]|nr:hypothetical protein CON64_18540 [Bacillus pseudomycoides]
MKIVHLFDKETKAYVEDTLLFPRQEEIKELIDKVYYEESATGVVEKHYKELVVVGYKEVYDIPENSTELPLPQPNWKPIFKDGKWIETITEEELEELNKPSETKPSKLESMALQVSDLEISLKEEQLKGEELAQTVSALEIAILELHPN